MALRSRFAALSAIVRAPPTRTESAPALLHRLYRLCCCSAVLLSRLMSPPPKYVDPLVLAAALAVFLLGGFPLLGFAAAAVAWLAQRGVQMVAAQRVRSELGAGNRQRAMGVLAATTLGRVWLMATVVLLTGLAERQAGLAAGVLLVVLFTVSFAAQGLSHLFAAGPEGQGAA